MANTNTTRRAVLAGAAVAAAVPLASLPALAAANPDAELLALGLELEETSRAVEVAAIPYNAARERIDAMYPRPKGVWGPEHAEWSESQSRAYDQPDVDRLWQAWSDAAAKEGRIAEQILAITAQTFEGLSVKADAMEAMFFDNQENCYDELFRLTDDIHRLAGWEVQS